jgi:hypothetical protein
VAGFDFGTAFGVLPNASKTVQGSLADSSDGGTANASMSVNSTVDDVAVTLRYSAAIVIGALIVLWLLGAFAFKGVSI